MIWESMYEPCIEFTPSCSVLPLKTPECRVQLTNGAYDRGLGEQRSRVKIDGREQGAMKNPLGAGNITKGKKEQGAQ